MASRSRHQRGDRPGAPRSLVTVGYAAASHAFVLAEPFRLFSLFRYILEAVIALAIFVVVAVTSATAARRRLSYEAWYWIHVAVYAAIVLAVFHQIGSGVDFVGHPLNRALWIALYIAVALCVVITSFGRVVRTYLRHRMRVEAVIPEAPNVASVRIKGHNVDLLGTDAGQSATTRSAPPACSDWCLMRGGVTCGLTAVVDWLHQVNATFSPFRPESDLSRLQRGDEERTSLAYSLCWCADGLIDPTGLVKGWDADRAWMTGIMHPLLPGRLIDADDAGIATSGPAERDALIIDPRSGAPATMAASVDVWTSRPFPGEVVIDGVQPEVPR